MDGKLHKRTSFFTTLIRILKTKNLGERKIRENILEKKKNWLNFFIRKPSSFGKEAEDIACKYLKRNGCRILKRNYSSRFGEIDIIARKFDTISFVEVKARAGVDFGSPSVFVTPQKQTKIKKTALFFITREKATGLNYRFDVISMVKNEKGSFEIEFLEGAFE